MVLNQELGTLRGGSRSNLGNPKYSSKSLVQNQEFRYVISKKYNFEVNPIGL